MSKNTYSKGVLVNNYDEENRTEYRKRPLLDYDQTYKSHYELSYSKKFEPKQETKTLKIDKESIGVFPGQIFFEKKQNYETTTSSNFKNPHEIIIEEIPLKPEELVKVKKPTTFVTEILSQYKK